MSKLNKVICRNFKNIPEGMNTWSVYAGCKVWLVQANDEDRYRTLVIINADLSESSCTFIDFNGNITHGSVRWLKENYRPICDVTEMTKIKIDGGPK